MSDLFAPQNVEDIRDRLTRVEDTACNCGDTPHENALHDLAHDDVPWLLDALEAAEARATTAEQDARKVRDGWFETVKERDALQAQKDAARIEGILDAADLIHAKDHRTDLGDDPHSTGWRHALNEAEHDLRQYALTDPPKAEPETGDHIGWTRTNRGVMRGFQ